MDDCNHLKSRYSQSMETWKPVPARPGYIASDLGRVASERNGRPLKGSNTGGGYRKIVFVGKPHMYIHHMVLDAFVGPRPDGAQCRHLNGDKMDNRLSNLAWGTPSENAADKASHGTVGFGEKNPMAKLTREAVTAMRSERESSGASFAKIGKMFGVSTMTAYRAVEGVSWK